jgi:mannose-6-phosphate isomerase-like protein (cupin superfamily)
MQTKTLPAHRDAIAPDGSDVRILLGVGGGGMAHFELAGGGTSQAVVHRTVEEIWYVLRGRGEMWRKLADVEEIVELAPDVCITIQVGTRFQFRSSHEGPLSAIGVTIPPWPGGGEAILTDGPWTPTVPPGPV